MIRNISETAQAIKQMEQYLRINGIIKDSKTDGKTSQRGLSDHIRAMVYSMLSAQNKWERIEKKKEQIDAIFYDYDPERINAESPEDFTNKIIDISCGTQRIKSQMMALKENIEKLKSFEKQCGSVDEYYQNLINEDGSLKKLVRSLSEYNSKDKMGEMGVALVAEYLRNVGYDLPKPDRHIRRILGNKILACSEKKIVPEFEVFDIIAELSKELGMPAAEVDYILWTYCADKYGEICTVSDPKCDTCVTKEYCQTGSKA